ncbi:hypothetical protein [Arthrobacter sp. UYCu723]
MAKNTTITVTVFRVERTKSTSYGNPMFKFHTDHGQFRTQANTAMAYALTNTFQVNESLNNGDGVAATLTLTPAGRVTGWELV